jgi:hypothetical protein
MIQNYLISDTLGSGGSTMGVFGISCSPKHLSELGCDSRALRFSLLISIQFLSQQGISKFCRSLAHFSSYQTPCQPQVTRMNVKSKLAANAREIPAHCQIFPVNLDNGCHEQDTLK